MAKHKVGKANRMDEEEGKKKKYNNGSLWRKPVSGERDLRMKQTGY